MSDTTYHLNTNQQALLRALNSSYLRKWVGGVDVISQYLQVHRIDASHLEKINQMVAMAKALRDVGLLEVRPNAAAQAFKWDMRITAFGRQHIKPRQQFLPVMTGVAIAVTACSSFSPQRTTIADIPPKATIPSRSIVGQASMIQVRDPNTGLVSWRYCNEDCPGPTPKVLATAQVPAVNAVDSASQASTTAQNSQTQAVQGLTSAVQKQIAQNLGVAQKAATEQVKSVATQTLSYAVFFQPGSAKLTKDGKDAIKELAPDMMRADAITIVGRADPTGPLALNERLSKARGEAVKSVLISEGIERSKIDIESRVGELQLDPKMTSLTSTPLTLAEQSRRTDLAIDLLVVKKR